MVGREDVGTTIFSDSPPTARGDGRKRFEREVKLSDIIVPIVVAALDASLSENEVNPVRCVCVCVHVQV